MESTHELSHAVVNTSKINSVEENHHNNINNLPQDVLLAIFRELLLTVREPNAALEPLSVGWDDDHLRPWPTYKSMMPRLTFTETLGTVCRHWRGVMSLASLFWTRLVIWVGKNATPLSQIREYLAWSRARLIDIYILQTSRMRLGWRPPEDEAQVKAHVKAALETLSPHMKRWRTLRIEVLHSSSLPRIRADLVGHADMLSTLDFEFTTDDCVASTGADSQVAGEFHTPLLENLSIGGLQFRESYVDPPASTSMLPRLRHLKVTNYDDSEHPPFPLVDLLRFLVNCDFDDLHSLDLANLHLACSYKGPPIREGRDIWCHEVSFTDMGGDVIVEYNRLLGYPFAEVVKYSRCSLKDLSELGESDIIRMEDIDEPQSVMCFLSDSRWESPCTTLAFTACCGLTPEVLSMLGQPMPDGAWFCPYLTSLVIALCGGCTSADLRKLVRARFEVHAATGFPHPGDPEFVVTSIVALEVLMSYELAPEDKEWFDTNLAYVRWDNWEGGYTRSLQESEAVSRDG
ncbi:hypothetical protein DAEQUDRAFT_412644 [Daedalea quercina L-15889]|uniref:F-box domain-containing protein n=1 Tax=Daedalea quercina L-15889 TaxID=1314783 RepID=A0A165NLS4_9APHY|nr:hypothetical protein DAEQUDRAFT_412644 [Daedalea quercina L-15889]